MRLLKTKLVFLLGVLGMTGYLSCGRREAESALLVSDNPLFALYVAEFNAAQDDYTVEFEYVESMAEKITSGKSKVNGKSEEASPPERSDMLAGNYLRDANVNLTFREITEKDLPREILHNYFYPELLVSGKIDDKQYLLPVSFDLNLVAFSKENTRLLSDSWIVSLDEIKKLHLEYSDKKNNVYSRMGFSPFWNLDFLLVAEDLFGSEFVHNNPLDFNGENLDKGILWCASLLRDLAAEGDYEGTLREVDDFTFKYLYEPPDKLAANLTILFTLFKASDFFLLKDERANRLDYRWIMHDNHVDMCENLVYFGIKKKTKSLPACRAFASWFFDMDTQKRLLQLTGDFSIQDSYFGIAGGFSAIQRVVEEVYPLFYPAIIGRLPPSLNFDVPNILPCNFDDIKNRVLLPRLQEAVRNAVMQNAGNAVNNADILKRNLRDYVRSSY
jgi:hypothetical protein